MGKMLTVKEVAARLKLAPSTVYGMIDAGEFPAFRFGGALRVDEDELEAWKEARRTAAANVPPPPPRIPGKPGRPRGKKNARELYEGPPELVYTGLQCLSRYRKA